MTRNYNFHCFLKLTISIIKTFAMNNVFLSLEKFFFSENNDVIPLVVDINRSSSYKNIPKEIFMS